MRQLAGRVVVKGLGTEVLLPKEEIMRRVTELAASITKDYTGKDLLVVGVLKGSFIFMADLIRVIQIPSTVDFVRIASYGRKKVSAGRIVLDKPSRRLVPFTADYVGFSIPDEFVVGYGLDCDEKYRYFPEVRILRESE